MKNLSIAILTLTALWSPRVHAQALAQTRAPSASSPSSAGSGATTPPDSTPRDRTPAQPQLPTDDDPRRHHGLYVSLQIPIGTRSFKVSTAGTEYTLSGFGAGFGILVGGTPAENLVIHSELSVTSASDPTLKSVAGSGTANGGSIGTVGIGAGALYYLMPWNVYLGGALTLSRANFTFQDTSATTDFGVGAIFRAGKELWIKDHWGLGLGLEYRLANMGGDDGDTTLTASMLGIAISSVYN
ncbi:MAG TPA: hypothetical protein VHM70_17345 [Polyangiaceae bacterium]|nr:hypothetical protein [Polyangiaceae bacterium]